MKKNFRLVWLFWLLSVALIAVYLGYPLATQTNQAHFLIGETTHGHHQIELACQTCHVDAFAGKEGIQKACLGCHAEELRLANDSHPINKFLDPRNADRIAILDARSCIACHTEHREELTHAMGVTLQEDFCFACHEQVAEERPSHQGLEFDSCASAGCHNFHDNRALYEDFLVKHANQPVIKGIARIGLKARSATERQQKLTAAAAVGIENMNVPKDLAANSQVNESWYHSAHSAAAVGCNDCHSSDNQAWIEKPDHNRCKSCHGLEVKTFLLGKHGMRLAALDKTANTTGRVKLSPMSPALARIPMVATASHRELGCSSCHADHDYDVRPAAVESCLGCHADEHSLAYKKSKHAQLWQAELAGALPSGSGVSCASCHMPRSLHRELGEEKIFVQHNQNENLRPNEKMIRSVCMDCHGLGFVIDALADIELIQRNFQGKPAKIVESINWALQRE